MKNLSKNFPYESSVDASSVQMDEVAISKISDLFLRQYQSNKFPGGQLVVRRKGKPVLNLSCGVARGWRERGGDNVVDVTESTPFPVYSAGKPMAAVVIAMLEAQKVLDVNSPVVKILPEFAGKGRDKITVLDVLTHRAGILLPELIDNHKLWGDRDGVWQFLLSREPRYRQGTFAYMPGEYGIILDQLVTRITGNSIATTFREKLALPIGLGNMQYGLGAHQQNDIAWSYWQGSDRCMVAGMNVADGFEEKNNDAAVFSAKNPAFSMVTDAVSLAAFYEFLVNGGRTYDGQQLISEKTIRRYTQKQISGWNKTVNAYLSLGYGFMLGTLGPSPYGWWNTGDSFGHAGIFSSLAYGDHKTGISVAIVTNGNKSLGDFFLRVVKITNSLRKACY